MVVRSAPSMGNSWITAIAMSASSVECDNSTSSPSRLPRVRGQLSGDLATIPGPSCGQLTDDVIGPATKSGNRPPSFAKMGTQCPTLGHMDHERDTGRSRLPRPLSRTSTGPAEADVECTAVEDDESLRRFSGVREVSLKACWVVALSKSRS